MIETDIAYLTGLFDGEGCVHIKRTKRFDTPCGVQYALNVVVRMASEKAVRRFQDLFGGHVYLLKKKVLWHKDQWQWMALSSVAQNFLEITLPYLIVKKAEAELALKFQKEKKRTIAQKGIRGFLRKSIEEIQKEENFYKNMRYLKLQKREVYDG